MTEGRESIRALATVTLDARALDELGPETIERLAELVEARLVARRAAGEEPLLSAVAAAELVSVSPETIRRAIRSGALEAAGYVGARPRVRRAEVEGWIAGNGRLKRPTRRRCRGRDGGHGRGGVCSATRSRGSGVARRERPSDRAQGRFGVLASALA